MKKICAKLISAPQPDPALAAAGQDAAHTTGKPREVATENDLQTLKNPGDGVSFPVYFRTNDAGITPELGQHIRDLAILIRAYPQIKVRLDAYADERGLPSYNLQLGKARALSVHKQLSRAGLPSSRIVQYVHGQTQAGDGCGDPGAYLFERRVDVRLTFDTGN